MSCFEQFHFVRPLWLLLLPAAAGCWWLVQRRKDPLRGWRVCMEPELLAALAVPASGLPSGGLGKESRGQGAARVWGYLGGVREVGLLAAWLTAVVALAGPSWRPEPSPFADDPAPVMLVLKADVSMDRTDLAPSRMERARLKIADFAAERPGQPVGLIAYAGSAHLVLPPTRDTAVVASMAAEIGPSVMPRPGDELVAALRLAAETLGAAGGSIVVLADAAPPGRDADWRAFRSKAATPVYLWGVARPDAAEWDGLNAAAAALGASVTRLTPDDEDVQSVVRRTARAPVAVAAAGEEVRWAEAGWWLTPLLALYALATFRQTRDANADAERAAERLVAADDPAQGNAEETRG